MVLARKYSYFIYTFHAPMPSTRLPVSKVGIISLFLYRNRAMPPSTILPMLTAPSCSWC